MRPVIFISNPFGFGPTGKAVALISVLRQKWRGNIIYAASDKCLEPLSESLRSEIIVKKINERDQKEIQGLIKKFSNPLVIIVLNGEAVKAAADLEVKSFFVDSLTYMWEEIPDKYLLADRYYYIDIFNAHQKAKGISQAQPVPAILGDLTMTKDTQKNYFLLHIGGFSNPLLSGMNQSYLQLLAQFLNQTKEKVILAGGKQAANFLKRLVNNDFVEIDTFGHREFVILMNEAERMLTTAGMTATLESFSLKTPVFFLPPNNLSQWRQTNLFHHSAGVVYISWEEVMGRELELEGMPEKEAIGKIRKISDQVLESRERAAKFKDLIADLSSRPTSIEGQNNFIDKLGVNGAEIIVNDILKEVN